MRDLAATVDTKLLTPCDVRSDDDLDRVFAETADAFGGGLDLLVHSVAFAAAEDLEGRFTDTPRDRFWMAVDISAYSLVACARRAEPLMESRGGGAIVTIEPPLRASISGSAARAQATSEYALMSTAIQKRSRGVSVKRPSRSSAAANATE